jgi:hypothetical protein
MAKSQFDIVMETFGKGNLHDPNNKPITKMNQALGVAFAEERAVEDKGRSKRTFKGRTRLRPKKKDK